MHVLYTPVLVAQLWVFLFTFAPGVFFTPLFQSTARTFAEVLAHRTFQRKIEKFSLGRSSSKVTLTRLAEANIELGKKVSDMKKVNVAAFEKHLIPGAIDNKNWLKEFAAIRFVAQILSLLTVPMLDSP